MRSGIAMYFTKKYENLLKGLILSDTEVDRKKVLKNLYNWLEKHV